MRTLALSNAELQTLAPKIRRWVTAAVAAPRLPMPDLRRTSTGNWYEHPRGWSLGLAWTPQGASLMIGFESQKHMAAFERWLATQPAITGPQTPVREGRLR